MTPDVLPLLGELLDALGDGLVVLAGNGLVLASNRRFRALFPLSPPAETDDERVAMALGPLHTTADRLSSGATRHHTISYADARVIALTILPWPPQEPSIVIAIFRDMSESARREIDFDRQRAFLEKAQSVAGIGSWEAEMDGSERLVWSEEMRHITGRSPMDLTRVQTMRELVHPDDRERVMWGRNAALKGGATFGVEHRIVRPDDSVRWVHTRGEVVRDPEGRPVRVIGTMQDVTERRALEDQLRQSQKLEALGRLASGIAHDINNALTAIIGYTEQAMEGVERLPASDQLRQDVTEIQLAARRAEAVARQLPAFSRKQVLAPRMFQLEDAVQSMGRMLERSMGPTISVRTTIEPELPPIYGDRLQIEQAIVNLAVNARDAMPDGGTLAITLESTSSETLSARPFEPLRVGRYVVLIVADTGHGMDPQTLGRVFEPFFTTKEPGKGSGLGLAMVHSTVTQSGGLIVVESEPQRGTTFRAYFPASAARRGVSGQMEPEHPVVARDRARPSTVLVVEDEAPLLRLVATTLTREGLDVLTAESAETALALLAGGDRSIDLLVTDVNMRGRSGIELADALSARQPGLPIVFMTGKDPGDTLAATLGTSRRLVPKPFAPRDVRRIVREMLALP